MGRFAFVGPTLLLASCSDSPSPSGPTPSATMTVSYVAGGQATITSEDMNVFQESRELSPGDTLYCAGITVLGSTPDGPVDPERPQVSNVRVNACGDEFKTFPVTFDGVIDGTMVDQGSSSARGNDLEYEADSGTVHVAPLDGEFAQVDFDAWYRPRGHGPGAPFVFRITGQLITD